MNLLQAEVLAASAVIVAPVLVFSDFQCSRFVAVVFRHGVLLSKERPAVDAWNSSISADPPFLSKTFNAIAKKYNAKAKMAIIRIHELHYPETTSDQHGELRVHDQLAGDGITV
jgi:hypothetical protein